MIDLVHAANVFLHSNICKVNIRTTPPDGEFQSVHGIFSYILVLTFMKSSKTDHGGAVHNVVKIVLKLRDIIPCSIYNNITQVIHP